MTTPLRRYYRGRDLVAMRDEVAQTIRYYHFDHQGTTQFLTDGTGAVTDRFASDAWGVQVKRTGSTINRHWYIGNRGYYRSPDLPNTYTGQYVPRSRSGELVAHLGRWTSRRAALVASAEPLYACGSNSPTTPLFGVLAAPQGPYLVKMNHLEAVIRNQCGLALWRVQWSLQDKSYKDFDYANQSIKGIIVQKVRFSEGDQKIESCTNPKEEVYFPSGCTYYEAWEYHWTKGQTARPQARDDNFQAHPSQKNNPSLLPSRATRGSWSIIGKASFIEENPNNPNDPIGRIIPKSRGGIWEKGHLDRIIGPECRGVSAGLLWVSKVAPPGFIEENADLIRTFSLAWDCTCDENCRITNCDPIAKTIGRRPRKYPCKGLLR